jgi:acetyl-CoA acetyltransferase
MLTLCCVGNCTTNKAPKCSTLKCPVFLKQVDWAAVTDVIYGWANQAGEDNRNVARMSSLLAGLPVSVSESTVNRLCGSRLDTLGIAERAIKSGEAS